VNLEEQVLASGNTDTDSADAPSDDRAPSSFAAANDNGASGARIVDAPAAEPVDLLEASGASLLKRLAPVLGGLFVLLVLRRFSAARRAGTD